MYELPLSQSDQGIRSVFQSVYNNMILQRNLLYCARAHNLGANWIEGTFFWVFWYMGKLLLKTALSEFERIRLDLSKVRKFSRPFALMALNDSAIRT